MSNQTPRRRNVNMDIMMTKVIRVLEVLVAERDHVHEVDLSYEPSGNITERLDTLFEIVNDIRDEQDDHDGGDEDPAPQ